MKRISFLLIFACIYLGVNGQTTYLDSSFNVTGILALNHAGGVDVPAVSLTRPNGKSLMIGYSYFDTRVPASTLTTVTVVQFDQNGKLDSTFGQNGIVVLDQLKNDASAADAVLQPDGKLLITGKYLNSTVGPHHFVVRLNEEGSLDGGFGVNGVAGHPDVSLVAWGSSVAVQMDGKIVMGGNKFTFVPPGSGFNELALIRFNSDGSVDGSFGDIGLVVGNFATEVLSVAVGEDNLIYAGTSASKIARYLPNGLLDSSFGGDGLADLPDFGARQILIQPNGQVIVNGPEKGSFGQDFILRFNVDGTLDITFEDAGIGPNEWLIGMESDSDGKIVVGTESYQENSLRVFRYFPNGQLDVNYEKNIPPLPGTHFEYGLSLQPDGKVVLGGSSANGFFGSFCLLRLTENLELDLSFGQNGLAIQNAGTSQSTAHSMFLDHQNRVVVGGNATYIDGTTIINLSSVEGRGFVSRLNPDGSLDNTFSDMGYASVNFGGGLLNLIALQPDGKIISAGASNETFNYPNFSAIRLLPDGLSDPDFGSHNGLTVKGLDPTEVYEAYASAVGIAPDNAIVVMGKVATAGGNDKIALIRFDPDGWPDPSFGIDGGQFVDVIPGTKFDLNTGLIQSDGKILVAGTYTSGVPNIFVVRFMPDGTLDNTFGTGGVVLKPFTGLLYHLSGIVMQPDGHILISGNQGSTPSNLIVGRLNPDGTRDNTFSGDGLAVVNTGTVENGHAIAVLADGKIVVAGYSANSNAAVDSDPMLARLLADGTPDSSFAGTAYIVTNLPGANQLSALAIQTDGSYITAGYSNNDYLLIRYLSKLNVGLLAEPAFASELLVYPNPVRGQVAFAYTLSTQSNVSVELFDMQGKRCQSFLLNENRPQGEQTEYLNFAKNLTPGVYTLRIQAEKGSRSVQVLVVE